MYFKKLLLRWLCIVLAVFSSIYKKKNKLFLKNMLLYTPNEKYRNNRKEVERKDYWLIDLIY